MRNQSKPQFSAQAEQLINRFKYDYSSPNLTHRIKAEYNGEIESSELFLIKQEIARLNKKCQRVIDLRWRVEDLQIERRDIAGREHYLDKQSYAFLLKEMKNYNAFTFGVYESVMAFFEENKQAISAAEKVAHHALDVLRFGDTYSRHEERMNLAIQVSAYLLPADVLDFDFTPNIEEDTQAIQAITLNVSNTGLKVRIPQKIEEGQLVAIRFDGLEKDLVFQQPYMTYVCMHQHLNKGSGHYESSLVLLDIDSNQEFASYAKKMIFSYKHKYKVDIEPTVNAVLNKAHEQFYVDQTRTFTLYADDKGEFLYSIESEFSSSDCQYFEQGEQFVLPSLLYKDHAIKALLNKPFAFYFICKGNLDGETVYLSGFLDGSEESTSLFNGFSNRKSARLYKVTYAEMNRTAAMSTSSVPEDVQLEYGTERFHRFSSKLEGIINKIKHTLTFSPVLDESLTAFLDSSESTKPSKHFFLTSKQIKTTNMVRLIAESNDLRLEDRFDIKTSITLYYRGQTLRGKTVNVSTYGLCIQLESPATLSKGQNVELRFDKFVERSTMFDLNHCLYKVAHYKEGVLGLYNGEFSDHPGRAFWGRVLTNKLDRLVACGQSADTYGLNRALCNHASAQSPDIHLFIQFSGNRPLVSLVSLPRNSFDVPAKNKQLEANIEDFRRWMYHEDCYEDVEKLCVDLTTEKKMVSKAVLVIAFKQTGGTKEVKTVKLIPDTTASLTTLKTFVRLHKSQQHHVVFYFVSGSLTRHEFKRYYYDEMMYVKRYSPHKFEELRGKIDKVRAVFSLTKFDELLPLVEGKA